VLELLYEIYNVKWSCGVSTSCGTSTGEKSEQRYAWRAPSQLSAYQFVILGVVLYARRTVNLPFETLSMLSNGMLDAHVVTRVKFACVLTSPSTVSTKLRSPNQAYRSKQFIWHTYPMLTWRLPWQWSTCYRTRVWCENRYNSLEALCSYTIDHKQGTWCTDRLSWPPNYIRHCYRSTIETMFSYTCSTTTRTLRSIRTCHPYCRIPYRTSSDL
jgi:hypothetical protein